MPTPTPHGRSHPPAVDPQPQAKLEFLAQLLAGADGEARRGADLIPAGACRTGGGGALACRLVEVVCRGRRAEARRAAAALVEMGPPAQWPVTRRLLQCRSVQHRLKLLEALEALSPLLDRGTRIGLIQMLTLPFFQAQDRKGSEALGRLLGRLRAQLEDQADRIDAADAAPRQAQGPGPEAKVRHPPT
jgi:hypothetical protein